MELLAPAGTMENFIAALEAGANAIFLGGKVFNARSHAVNFSTEELREAVRLAHLLGVDVHVTVNILIGDQELQALKEYLIELQDIGVDAIIVQDLAVARLARKVAPRLLLHASTQMTVTNLKTVKFLEDLGFSRVVLAREMSLEEIRHICAYTKLEIETFVHGALCICYSGQCLMSSFIGGRSGNRGSCAQPCRLPYELLDSKNELQTPVKEVYVLSPKDLNYSHYVKDLIDAGVDSFKIEGRMKKVSYVRQVIGAYRKIIDNEGQVTAREEEQLLSGFNRGFSSAYLENRPGRAMMTILAPNNQGKPIGQAKPYQKKTMLSLSETIEKGDLLKIISSEGAVIYVTLDEQWKGLDKKTFVGPVMSGSVSGEVYLAAAAKNKKTHRGMSEFTRKYPIHAYLDGQEGSTISLTLLLEDGTSVTVTDDYVLQKANKVATSLEKVQTQLGRLGNTVFRLASVNMPEGSYMWPMSVLNELRRKAVNALESELLKRHTVLHAAKLASYNCHTSAKKKMDLEASDKSMRRYPQLDPIVSVRLDELWQIEVAIKAGAQKIVFGGDRLQRESYTLDIYKQAVDICNRYNVPITIAMPRLIKENEVSLYDKHLEAIVKANPQQVAINFLGGFTWLREKGYKGGIEGDTSLQIFNSDSLRYLMELGLSSVAISQEATLHQITQMGRNVDISIECVVQGQVELMISEYCVIGSFIGNGEKKNCPKPCMQESYKLRDRKGEEFPLRTDPYCRMHIMNSRELDLSPYMPELLKRHIKIFRIDARQRDAEYIMHYVKLYKGLIAGTIPVPEKETKNTDIAVTRGHYFKGIFD